MSIQDANQSQIRIDEFKGKKAVVKGVRHPGVPVLRRLEWWMLSREAEILQRLEEIEQVPDFLGYPEPFSFAMEWRAGESLRQVDPSELEESFFLELEETVDAIHRSGVTHSDLKRKENLIVSPDGRPVLLDFGASFRKKPWFRPLNNWLYNQFKRIDLNAVAKYKQRYAPQLCDEQDRRRLAEPVLLEKISRFGRRYILFRE